jgi:hypothetical protein
MPRAYSRSSSSTLVSPAVTRSSSAPSSMGWGGTAVWTVEGAPGTTGTPFIVVTALSVETLELSEDTSLAMLNIVMVPHTRGRAILIGTSTPAFTGIRLP